MKNRQLKLTVLIIFIGSNLVFGQKNYQIELLRKNKVKAIEFYNFEIVDDKVLPDSIMNVKAEFNSKGYVVNTLIYDSLKLKARYERIYQHDTILVEMNTYRGTNNELVGIAKFNYKEGNRIAEVHYKDEEKIIEVRNTYNEKNLLTKRIVFYKKQKSEKTKFEYNSNDQLVKRKSKKKSWTKLYYDKYGRHISTYQAKKNKRERNIYKIEYVGKTKTKSKVITKHYGSATTIGEGGILELKSGDVLMKKYYYHENGLIDYVQQFLNGQLDAVKKYKYVF